MERAESLKDLCAKLRHSEAVREKLTIRRRYASAEAYSAGVPIGDDCAAIPDGDAYLLFAAEGMLERFVASDPWFAGYSAVMVNISDIAAMGGAPLAIVDILWSSEETLSEQIWSGMQAAARAYDVPIVGGHTAPAPAGKAHLGAAIVGRARKLITSFDARPGDALLLAVDLRGSYRGAAPFWNASTGAPPERLRADLAVLPQVAASVERASGKDVSNGGIVGTLAMLLECSQVGADLRLDRLPRPPEADLFRWLISFPSFGYLLSVAPENSETVRGLFREREIACEVVGRVTRERDLTLCDGNERELFCRFGEEWGHHAKSL